MKTLQNQVILYDNDCPMCNIYTSAFIKAKWLNDNGRLPYQELDDNICTQIDMNRAKDEIALYDTEKHTVQYGMDSMFTIIGNAWPVFKPLFRNIAFRWIIKKLYCLITYNRKVIAAVKPKGTGRYTCTPAFNLKYRLIYLMLSLLFSSWIYGHFIHRIGYETRFSVVFVAVQVMLAGVIVWLLNSKKLIDYLGNMMTVHMIGALLLLPMLGIAKLFFIHQSWFYIGYGVLVLIFLVIEHQRRLKLLQL